MSLLGAIIGAYLVNGMQSYLGDALQQIWMILLGSIFIGVVLFLPKGIIGLIELVLSKFPVRNSEEKEVVDQSK